MIAFLVVLLAACTRFVPHLLHHDGINVTAVGAGLLFFGSRQPRWQAALAAGMLAISDVLLTTRVYHYPFHPQDYIITWVWYAAVALIGSGLLRQVSVVRVATAVFASATGFFVLSNLVVWAGSHFYAHTLAGLAACYTAAVPFYRNDLISTAEVAAVLFGLPAAVKLVRGASHPHPAVRPTA